MVSLDIDDIIGKPFQWGGRGPHAFDCIGIVLECIERATGIRVIDPFEQEPSPARLAQFRSLFQQLPNLAIVEPADVLHFRSITRLSDQHLAYVENSSRVIACAPDFGVYRLPMSRLPKYPDLQAYRLKKLC